MPVPTTFEQFRQDALAQGCYEVLVREWPAETVVAEHAHPFSARALIVKGEMWLRVDSAMERHLSVGDTFEVGCHQRHSERYGPEGATLWAGRSS